jgi:heme exporter protein D
MTSLTGAVLALRFSLDSYTDWYNSPGAAIYFWSAFTAVVLIVIALMMFVFRRMRPH